MFRLWAAVVVGGVRATFLQSAEHFVLRLPKSHTAELGLVVLGITLALAWPYQLALGWSGLAQLGDD
jgi:hypothetical protein